MRRDQLEHAIRAACSVAEDDELLIFGSQPILGTFPNAPESLRASVELDVQAKNKPGNTDLIDGALGEFSQFHITHGFYVHGIPVEFATLPAGWGKRTVPVSTCDTNGGTGYCLEVHDLAASKLFAHRDQDRVFVTTLIVEGLVDVATLIERIAMLPIDEERRDALTRWVRITAEDLE